MEPKMEEMEQEMMQEIMKREKDEKLEQYRRLNRFAQKGQILFVGSSLMEQFPIYELMMSRGIHKVIYNRGIGGYVAKELLDALQVCVLDLEPSRIFINIGTNDLNAPDLKMDDLMGTYREILTRILKALPQVQIYLMAYYPVNREAATTPWMQEALSIRTNERILAANREVEKLAASLHCRYINVNKNLYDEEGRLKKEYTKEGMHFYADGYEAILDDLMRYVNEG